MTLTPKDIQQILKRYDNGDGETVAELATAFGTSANTIAYHLKKRNVLQDEAPPIVEPAQADDLDFGVDEEPTATATNDDGDALATLMANPALAKLIDAAVSARIKQMAPTASFQNVQSDEFKAFISQMGRMIEVQAIQQPGYIKPLSAEEMDKRAAGRIEMLALRKKFQDAGTPPKYLLGTEGMFESANAILYEEGQEIRTYMDPPESATPLNDEGAAMYGAMLKWLGGHTSEIGSQVAAAMAAAKKPEAPLVTGTLSDARRNLPIEIVDAPVRNVRPRREAGTITPEQRGTAGMSNQAPIGPVF